MSLLRRLSLSSFRRRWDRVEPLSRIADIDSPRDQKNRDILYQLYTIKDEDEDNMKDFRRY